jgi:hypothetical protein
VGGHAHRTSWDAGLEGPLAALLLQLVVAGSLAATAVLLPGRFAVAVVRSASVLLQGVWFMGTGFALWVPALVPSGCHGVGVELEGSSAATRSAVVCATEEGGAERDGDCGQPAVQLCALGRVGRDGVPVPQGGHRVQLQALGVRAAPGAAHRRARPRRGCAAEHCASRSCAAADPAPRLLPVQPAVAFYN